MRDEKREEVRLVLKKFDFQVMDDTTREGIYNALESVGLSRRHHRVIYWREKNTVLIADHNCNVIISIEPCVVCSILEQSKN